MASVTRRLVAAEDLPARLASGSGSGARGRVIKTFWEYLAASQSRMSSVMMTTAA
jgi:hypothetical protein